MNTDFLIEKSVQIRQIRVIRVPNHGNSQRAYFIVLFVQSIVVLGYGIVARSRSLVIAPIAFAVIASVTVLYSKLKGLSPVLIIGGTGLVLLILGILAAVQRERITTLAERFGDWEA